MKKFKLIKEYPGSPVLHTVVTLERVVLEGIVNGQMIQGKWCYDIDKTPEYWEEVVEKDYQILSLSLATSINHKISDVSTSSETYIKGLLACKGNSIHSIKRLSDGEIFTVGDLCAIFKNGTFSSRIQSIQLIDENFIYVTANKWAQKFENIVKADVPLFRTEDGVDVYENNQIFYVHRESLAFISKCENISKDFKFFKELAYFSKFENAFMFRKMNRKSLSLEDVQQYLTEEQLQELIKKV